MAASKALLAVEIGTADEAFVGLEAVYSIGLVLGRGTGFDA